MHVTLGQLRGRLGLQVDHLEHPVVIDRGALAVARQKRRRHTRDAGQQDLVERLFEYIEARHSDDRVHVPGDDDLQDDRGPLAHEHLVPELLGLALESAPLHAPHFSQFSPNSSYSAGHPSAFFRQCGRSISRRWNGIAATWSRQNSLAMQTRVNPRYCSPNPICLRRESAWARNSSLVSGRAFSSERAKAAAASRIRSRSGRVSGMTLNWAVVAFLDFSSGGEVGGASESSNGGTAGSLSRTGRRPPAGGFGPKRL